MTALIQLAYVSRGTDALSDEEADRLAAQARLRNQRRDIRGFLYLENGRVFQVLEGESDTVRALFARIRRDPRHQDVRVVRDRSIDTHHFARWGMTRLDACPRLMARSMGCHMASPSQCLVNNCHDREGAVDHIIAAGALIHDMAATPGREILPTPAGGR
jgi:acylphosphatase